MAFGTVNVGGGSSAGAKGASIISAVRGSGINSPMYYEREEVINLKGATVEWHLTNATTANPGDILVVTIPPNPVEDGDPKYVFGTVVTIGGSAYGDQVRFVKLQIDGYILSGENGENGADGERGASIYSVYNIDYYAREEVAALSGKTVDWVLFSNVGKDAPMLEPGDLALVSLYDEKGDTNYVFAQVEAYNEDGGLDIDGSNGRGYTLHIVGYILSAEKGSGADLGSYFSIPAGDDGGISAQTLIIYNPDSSGKGVMVNGRKYSIAPGESVTIVTEGAGFTLTEHSGIETDCSPSIYHYIRQGNIDRYEITTCGILRLRYSYKCLTGDTLVTMADGTEMRLDQIEVGDEVLSFDWNTLQLVPNKVIATDKDEGKSHTCYDKWTFSDGTAVKTVHRHEFYNVEARGMKYMDAWKLGEHAYREDGEKVALVAHETVEETVRHYKITLEHGTNYFANGLLTGDRYCPKGIEL